MNINRGERGELTLFLFLSISSDFDRISNHVEIIIVNILSFGGEMLSGEQSFRTFEIFICVNFR